MSRMSIATAFALAVTILLAVTSWGPAPLAHANGNPVSIVMSYLQGVSSYGPTNATGLAEMVPREGEARITVTGLSRLTGDQYVVWIMNSGTREMMSLGGFNTGENGVGKLEITTKDPFPDKGWDTVFISVEAAGAIPNQAGNRRSIAGKWPVPGSGTGTGAGSQPGKPEVLPNTGGASETAPTVGASPSSSWAIVLAGLLLTIAVSGVIGFRLARSKQRRG